MNIILLFVGGIVTGWLSLIGYGCIRAVNSNGWDDSNALNWIRLFSHTILHPEDFGRMWYVDAHFEPRKRPFSYISKDEFSENFPDARPPPQLPKL